MASLVSRELIAASGRRVPRVARVREAAVARGTAALRAKHVGTAITMRTTPFPSRPCEVVTLTVPEFTCELDLNAAVSIDRVSQRFIEDTNRAVVWFIRFRALTAWCDRADIAGWLRSDPSHARHACEVAASFDLNSEWEFDAEPFRSAVESIVRDR